LGSAGAGGSLAALFGAFACENMARSTAAQTQNLISEGSKGSDGSLAAQLGAIPERGVAVSGTLL